MADHSGLRRVERIALVVFGLAAAYFLWTEHRAHVAPYLPWALLALCPLMHVFMHGGHSGHGGHAHADDRVRREP
jgi:hypothetical protein